MRLALPKGRLLDGVLGVLAKACVTFTFASDRDYHPTCTEPDICGVLRKVRAIPQLIALGNIEAGFCGLDLVRESGYDAVVPLLDLGLNRVRLVVAVSADRPNMISLPPRRPLVIATEYEQIATRWAFARGLSHIIVQTWGSTESYVPEDADVVFDTVETGNTIAANGLTIVEEVMASTTHLVANRDAYAEEETRRKIDALIARIARGAEEQ